MEGGWQNGDVGTEQHKRTYGTSASASLEITRIRPTEAFDPSLVLWGHRRCDELGNQ